MTYRIVLQDPPPRVNRNGRQTKVDTLRDLLRQIDAEHPDRWVLIDKASKKQSTFYYLRKEEFPQMEIVTRKNADGKSSAVYLRMVSAKKVSV